MRRHATPPEEHGVGAETLIALPTWCLIFQPRLRVSDTKRDWPMAVNDHEEDYKRHPDFPPHAGLAVIALRSPVGNHLYGFTPRNQLFGGIASLLQ